MAPRRKPGRAKSVVTSSGVRKPTVTARPRSKRISAAAAAVSASEAVEAASPTPPAELTGSTESDISDLSEPVSIVSTRASSPNAIELLPSKIEPDAPLPTLPWPQTWDGNGPDGHVTDRSFNSFQDSGVLLESIMRSKSKWAIDGVLERFWSTSAPRRKQTNTTTTDVNATAASKEADKEKERAKKRSMMKIGPYRLTVEPHIFDITVYTVRRDPLPGEYLLTEKIPVLKRQINPIPATPYSRMPTNSLPPTATRQAGSSHPSSTPTAVTASGRPKNPFVTSGPHVLNTPSFHTIRPQLLGKPLSSKMGPPQSAVASPSPARTGVVATTPAWLSTPTRPGTAGFAPVGTPTQTISPSSTGAPTGTPQPLAPATSSTVVGAVPAGTSTPKTTIAPSATIGAAPVTPIAPSVPTTPATVAPAPPATTAAPALAATPATPAVPLTPAQRVDPVIQMLAHRASTDSELKRVMRIVASGEATPTQLDYFQRHIDELSAIVKARKELQQQQLQQNRTPAANSVTAPGSAVAQPSTGKVGSQGGEKTSGKGGLIPNSMTSTGAASPLPTASPINLISPAVATTPASRPLLASHQHTFHAYQPPVATTGSNPLLKSFPITTPTLSFSASPSPLSVTPKSSQITGSAQSRARGQNSSAPPPVYLLIEFDINPADRWLLPRMTILDYREDSHHVLASFLVLRDSKGNIVKEKPRISTEPSKVPAAVGYPYGSGQKLKKKPEQTGKQEGGDPALTGLIGSTGSTGPTATTEPPMAPSGEPRQEECKGDDRGDQAGVSDSTNSQSREKSSSGAGASSGSGQAEGSHPCSDAQFTQSEASQTGAKTKMEQHPDTDANKHQAAAPAGDRRSQSVTGVTTGPNGRVSGGVSAPTVSSAVPPFDLDIAHPPLVYEPVTIRFAIPPDVVPAATTAAAAAAGIAEDDHKLLMALSRAVAPQSEVQDYMRHIFSIGKRADKHFLAYRLPVPTDTT